MKVAILTSSRADYSIYLPLLKKMRQDSFFETIIIAFGTHTSEKFGKTMDAITQDGFTVNYALETLPVSDSPLEISKSVGKTIIDFANLWQKIYKQLDLVICLGDRYEMFAAVSATIPFNIPMAHIHGGETTLGAIDNTYRHSLTHMATYHFASTAGHAARVGELKGNSEHVYNVGSLSLDNINDLEFLDEVGFEKKFSIPIKNPVLVTLHPETINHDMNLFYINELLSAISGLNEQIIITLPNADTSSSIIREAFVSFAAKNTGRVFAVESLGTQGYFSCMKMCSFILGNSSSGIIEAASFKKYVINLGNRQKGREHGPNVIHCEISATAIIAACKKVMELPLPQGKNVYGDGNASREIINILKAI